MRIGFRSHCQKQSQFTVLYLSIHVDVSLWDTYDGCSDKLLVSDINADPGKNKIQNIDQLSDAEQIPVLILTIKSFIQLTLSACGHVMPHLKVLNKYNLIMKLLNCTYSNNKVIRLWESFCANLKVTSQVAIWYLLLTSVDT